MENKIELNLETILKEIEDLTKKYLILKKEKEETNLI